MRPPQELEAELVRTRRKLYRLTGVMTFIFIACLIVVFAAVGGALIVVDKRAARTLPAEANDTHQAATAPQAAHAPVAPVAPALAHADAAPPTTVAAAPANPPPPPVSPPAPPQTHLAATTGAAATAGRPTPPPLRAQENHQVPTPPAAGSAGTGIKTAQPAALPRQVPVQAPAPAPSTDVKRTARAHPQDERSTVGAAPSEPALRSDDLRDRRRAHARARPGEDEAVANGPRPQRVIVVGPPPQDQARPDDDQGAPPRRHDFFGGLFGGIFGNRDQ